jgi:ABC-type molybdate transport system substrate-binding protein
MLLRILLFTLISSISFAEVNIAVASNFHNAMEEIKAIYPQKINVTYGSSGHFVNQILASKQSLFDVLILADVYSHKLDSLDKNNYAQGQLVLAKLKGDNIDLSACNLDDIKGKMIARADENLAPYGKASMEFINDNNTFIVGQNISQPKIHLLAKTVDLAFMALADAKFNGDIEYCKLNHSYQISQEALLIKEEGRAFWEFFLTNPQVKAIIDKYYR